MSDLVSVSVQTPLRELKVEQWVTLYKTSTFTLSIGVTCVIIMQEMFHTIIRTIARKLVNRMCNWIIRFRGILIEDNADYFDFQ